MTSLRRDLVEAIESCLREHGVSDWDVDKSSGHMKYHFVFNGTERMFVTAGSPSDCRGLQNALTDLRLTMGVKKTVRKNPANRRGVYRKAAAVRLEMPTVTAGRDMWATLVGFVAEPHFGPLGVGCMDIDAAGRDLADAIVGVA